VQTRRRCAQCYKPISQPTGRGRPRRTCDDACRQAKSRLSRKTQGSLVERVLAKHGFDGKRLEKLARRIALDVIRRSGGVPGEKHEDLVAYLCERGLRAASRYDDSRRQASYGSRGGNAFESYLSDVLERRTVDWMRSRAEGFADYRRWPGGSPIDLVGDDVDTLKTAYGDAVEELAAAEERDFGLALARISARLSEEGRQTLELIGLPLFDGWRPGQIRDAAGIPFREQRKRLEALREELSAAGLGG
jgi:DNA-directed RNA polymerase specialized sigma24 family protein